MVLLVALGIGVGWGIGTTVPPQAAHTVTATVSSNVTSTVVSTVSSTVVSTVAATNSSSPFVLTLVLTTNNVYNSTIGTQPAYFVLGPNGLESSANINLPANRLIKLIIVCYDNGSANLLVPVDNGVSGTVNGTILVASNNASDASQGPSSIVINGSQSLTYVPEDELAHTFSVPSLNLNIPVPLSSTVVAYFTIPKPGTYLWLCETNCGSGPLGTLGAMSTMGWMTGSLVAS